jgi:radical SAM-linked protein
MMDRIRFRYACGKELRYLSHLDLLRLFQRAMRRARLPLAYTLGFNPRPKLSLATPLPVGVTASKEYGEIFLVEPVSPASFRQRLGEQLPKGLTLTGAVVVPVNEPPLASVVNAALYRAAWKSSRPAPTDTMLQKALDKLLAQPAIMIRRFGKSGKITRQNIRPYIFSAELLTSGEQDPALRLLLQVGSKGGVSPSRFLEQLALKGDYTGGEHCWCVHRQGLYIYRECLIDPFPEGGETLDG